MFSVLTTKKKGDTGTWGAGGYIYTSIVMMVSQICFPMSPQTHQMVHIKYVHFRVCFNGTSTKLLNDK